eukprot:TRINITY_DN60088_c0_g1_i1.p1 TRINITY_DN60088_c0_g1~~TRINITY_DN60088_c0_g1_i1.p1  ORF type:complete len:371 (+),score=91.94 TRINITY_DN60088_c0_g1_i1:80-1192(+)
MPVPREAAGAQPQRPPAGGSAAQRWTGMGAQGVYVALCKELRCKVNSEFAAVLPDAPGDFSVSAIDLSRNIVGPKGVVPVMEVARLSLGLRSVNLGDNYLDNPAVRAVTLALKEHPAVESVDFSRNPISWTAGMSILELVTANHSITHVGLERTFLKPNIIETIQAQTQRNRELQAKRKAKGPNPTNHPLTIRMRALKRLFHDLVVQEGTNGRIPKRCIVDAYKENMRMQSREAELEQHSVAFYEELKRRCNADEEGLIGWETFLVVSMIDDVGFQQGEIDRIKETFHRFDADGNGYIDLFELRTLLTEATGQPPTEEYVKEKMTMFDADGSHTITLDEFIVMTVDRGPTAGGVTLVPQAPPQQARPRHL